MRSSFIPAFAGALCLGAVFVWLAPAPADDSVPPVPPVPPQNDVTPEARGPVNEAYAEPAETRPEPGPIIPKQPPEPIQELPPDQKPAGDNIEWIPGYWAWDSETTDFTWVSGFWRAPPPNRDWTPGHWQQVDGGWQWVPGFWAPQDAQQVEYLPPPPPSIDNGPSVPATDETSTYVPGCWIYRETRYLWRPGYWVEANPNWCWIPDHYCWSPVGYVFVAGYWDYPLESRGLLFAPVRFNRRVYEAANFVYTPEYVIQPDFLLGALFVRPAYSSYYFGDYFEPQYLKSGFTPWVDYRVGRYAYDPNFAFYRRRYRNDDHWAASLRELYALRRSGEAPRPPRTLIQQTQIVNNITINKSENVTINKSIHITNLQSVTALTPINKVGGIKITGLAGLTGAKPGEGRAVPLARTIKLEAVPKERLAEVKQHAAQLRQFAVAQRQEQAKILSSGTMPVKPTDRPRAVSIALPKNPVRAAVPRAEGNAPVRAPSPPPAPKHEERPIPAHEPPRPSAPPKVAAPGPGPKEPPTQGREPTPPRREPVPPAVKEPPMPPRREPPAPSKEPPMPPRREPPPPAVKEPPMPPRREPPPTVKEPPMPPMPPRREPPAPAKEPPMPPRREPPPPAVKEPPQREPAQPPRREPTPPAPAHREPPPPTPPAPAHQAPPAAPPAPARREPPPAPPAPAHQAPPPAPVRKEPPPAPPGKEPPPKDKPPSAIGH